MSQGCGDLGTPRWSARRQLRFSSAASSAGLVGDNACVGVGPPFAARGPRRGSKLGGVLRARRNDARGDAPFQPSLVALRVSLTWSRKRPASTSFSARLLRTHGGQMPIAGSVIHHPTATSAPTDSVSTLSPHSEQVHFIDFSSRTTGTSVRSRTGKTPSLSGRWAAAICRRRFRGGRMGGNSASLPPAPAGAVGRPRGADLPGRSGRGQA
jgi:hypothetical protein